MSSLVARRLRSAMGVSILATLAACGGQVSPQTNTSPAGAASSPPSAASPAPAITLGTTPNTVVMGRTLVGCGTGATACTASDGWSGSVATSGTQSMDAITATKTYTLSCTGTGGSAAQSATVTVTSGAPTGGTVSRPSYNTGDGFFVLNGKLYDPNGNEFRIRGVNRNHYDSKSSAGIAKSGANAVRIFVETDYGQSVAGLVNIVQTQHIGQKEVPIVTSPIYGGTNTSCSSSTTLFNSLVSNLVATASSWTPLNK